MKRVVFLISLLFRFGSIACFVASGAYGARVYGPELFNVIRTKLAERDTDPLVLAQRELEMKKAMKVKKKGGAATHDAERTTQNAKDDPYKYVQGGKKAEPEKDSSADKDEDKNDLASQNADNFLAKTGGQSLWDTKNLESRFGGLAGEGGEDAGGLAGGFAGGSAEASSKKAMQQMASAQSMAAGSAGLGAEGGKMSRPSRHGIMRKGGVRSQRASGLQSAKGAARAAGRGFASGNFQTVGGSGGFIAGEGKTQSTLAMPSGGIGAAQVPGGLDTPTTVPGVPEEILEPDVPENEQGTQSSYSGYENALIALGLVGAGLGIALAFTTNSLKNVPALNAWWWAMYAAAAAITVAIWGVIGALLSKEDPMAKQIAVGFISMAIMMTAGLTLVLFSKVLSMAKFMFIGQALQGLIQAIMKGVGGGGGSAPPTPPPQSR